MCTSVSSSEAASFAMSRASASSRERSFREFALEECRPMRSVLLLMALRAEMELSFMFAEGTRLRTSKRSATSTPPSPESSGTGVS